MMRLVEIEEMRPFPRLHQRAAEHLVQGLPRDRPPAEPGDHRMDLRRAGGVAQGEVDVVGELPAHADREALLDHHDVLARPTSTSRSAWVGNGRKETSVTRPMRHTIGAHLVDRVLDGAVHRAHGDDEHLGILGAIGAQQPAGFAPEPSS